MISEFDFIHLVTDDFTDLLLSGTEVAGSCQRIGGAPHLNKCLLAYLMDGKNRLLAVKDRGGKIVGRTVLRLLWNETAEKPVLFLDRVYPDMLNSALKELLLQGGKEVARQLGIPLLWGGIGDSYPDTVVSLGGVAPYEHADSGGGVMPESHFVIRGARLLR